MVRLWRNQQYPRLNVKFCQKYARTDLRLRQIVSAVFTKIPSNACKHKYIFVVDTVTAPCLCIKMLLWHKTWGVYNMLSLFICCTSSVEFYYVDVGVGLGRRFDGIGGISGGSVSWQPWALIKYGSTEARRAICGVECGRTIYTLFVAV